MIDVGKYSNEAKSNQAILYQGANSAGQANKWNNSIFYNVTQYKKKVAKRFAKGYI